MKKHDGRFLLVFIAVAILALFCACDKKSPESEQQPVSESKSHPAPPAPNVVAKVNDNLITQEEWDKEVSRMMVGFMRSGTAPTDGEMNALRKTALDNLIGRELLYMESSAKGVKVDDAELDQRIQDLKGRFESDDRFQESIKEMGLTPDTLREQIKRAMVIDRFIDQEFASKVAITDKEVKDYYDAHPELFTKGESISARHILIMVAPNADDAKKAEAKAKIDEALKRARAGEDFAALAKEYSEDTTKEDGGNLGIIQKGQTVKPFEDAAFALKPGEISDIVETRFGYHIIKVDSRQEPEKVPFEEIKEQLANYLREDQIQQDISQFIKKARTKATVELFLPESG